LAWEFVKKSGAWLSITEDFKEVLQDTDFDLPEKIQGENNLFKLIEGNEGFCEFLVSYFKNAIEELG